jgi:cytochrome c-type biogenesis protein CcmH
MKRDPILTMPHCLSRRSASWLIPLFAFLLCGAALFVQPARSQDDAPATPVATAGQNAVNDVARQLWCPLCSGVRLDACELKACDQMKEQIGQKLAAGEDVQSIKNYFVAQYGPQVLGEPPLEGFNWLAWLLPVIVVVGGGLFVWSRARGMMRKTPVTTTASNNSAAATPAGDNYSEKLEEELKHYD